MDRQRVAAHLGADGGFNLPHQADDRDILQIAAAVAVQMAVRGGGFVKPVGAVRHFKPTDFTGLLHELEVAVNGAAGNVRHFTAGLGKDLVRRQMAGAFLHQVQNQATLACHGHPVLSA